MTITGLTIHEVMAQRSDEWYAARCGMVTASEIGSLITPRTIKVAENMEVRELTARLAAERILGYADPTYVGEDMWRGIEAEEYVRDAYSEHYAPVAECGFLVRDLDSGKLGFSPDGLVGEDGLIEVKAPRPKGHLLTVLADEVPIEHMAQCQAGLLVSGRKWLDFVSFSGGMALYVRRVVPDPRWFEAITTAVANFEDAVSRMVAEYHSATAGLPMTERRDLEMVI